jgi:group II intron reverse transcriptase/maturase
MDVEKFFDNVDHKWMTECLKQRVADKGLLRLIVRFLKAGIMEEGKYLESEKGTPQGGVLSPVLANIYLHFILDLWFERVARKQFKGYVKQIRYADDFIACFESMEEAVRFSDMLKQRLAKFGLKVAEDKSRVIEFGREVWEKSEQGGGKPPTFDFLGFTHYCDRTRRGRFKVGRRTSGKKFRQKMKEMNQWLKGVRNLVKLDEWWKALRMKLYGHYRYYGISGNMKAIHRFYFQTSLLAFKWVNRRSQKKSCDFAAYLKLLHDTLPTPRIYHNSYSLASV